VRSEGFVAVSTGKPLNNFAASAGQALHRDRVLVADKQVQSGHKLRSGNQYLRKRLLVDIAHLTIL
jgi:hypothetical protein